MKSINFFFIFFFAFTLTGQNAGFDWVHHYMCGNTITSAYTEGLAIDDSGNVYTSGYFAGDLILDSTLSLQNPTNGFALWNGFLAKTNNSGQILWANRVAGYIHWTGMEVKVDKAGGVFVFGTFLDSLDFDGDTSQYELIYPGRQDKFIAKYSSNGTFLWARALTGALDFAVDSIGNSYICGKVLGYNIDIDPGPGVHIVPSGELGYFHKLDTLGNLEWVKLLQGTNTQSIAEVELIEIGPNGNLYLHGTHYGTIDFDPGMGVTNLTNQTSGGSIFLSKYNFSGDLIWVKNFEHRFLTINNPMSIDPQENLYITGNLAPNVPFDFDPGPDSLFLVSGNQDIYVAKYDTSGSLTWAFQIGNQGYEGPAHITLGPDTNVYLTSSFNGTLDFDPDPLDTFNLTSNITGFGGRSGFIAKYNSSADFIWTKHLHGHIVEPSSIKVSKQLEIYTYGDFKDSCDFDPSSRLHVLHYSGGGDRDGFLNKLNTCAPSYDTLSLIACNRYVHPISLDTIFNSGTYVDTTSNQLGCDSILVLHLDIINRDTLLNVTSCSSYTLPGGNKTWNSSGIYSDTLQSSIGCDSVITVQLQLLQSSSIISLSACDSLISPSGKYVWTQSGTYQDTLINSANCDSILTVNLTLTSIDTLVTLANNVLTANEGLAQYQWLDCNQGMSPIAGETSNDFEPKINGSYAVEITKSLCKDTSGCHPIFDIGVHGIHPISEFGAYPNPTEGTFSVELGSTHPEVEVYLRDVTGQLVSQNSYTNARVCTLSIDGPDGVYFAEIFNQSGKEVIKILKINN